MTRFSVGLPQLDADPASIAPYAVRAEELGFEGLWTLDSAVGGPTDRMRPRLKSLVTDVKTTARSISMLLGYDEDRR